MTKAILRRALKSLPVLHKSNIKAGLLIVDFEFNVQRNWLLRVSIQISREALSHFGPVPGMMLEIVLLKRLLRYMV